MEYPKIIKKQIHTLKKLDFEIDHSWTLFLDRDGVINRRRIGDYVKTWEEFEFLPGSLEAIVDFSKWFHVLVVVTNQQGIGKGLMSENDLNSIHKQMVKSIKDAGGRIDKVYHCPNLRSDHAECRKPKPGMGMQAQKDFPSIDFSKSIMVGDSISDMQFGEALGMKNIFISEDGLNNDDNLTQFNATSLTVLTSILKDKMT